ATPHVVLGKGRTGRPGGRTGRCRAVMRRHGAWGPLRGQHRPGAARLPVSRLPSGAQRASEAPVRGGTVALARGKCPYTASLMNGRRVLPWGGPAVERCPHAAPAACCPPRGHLLPWDGPAVERHPHAAPVACCPPRGHLLPWDGPAAKNHPFCYHQVSVFGQFLPFRHISEIFPCRIPACLIRLRPIHEAAILPACLVNAF